MAPSLPSLTPAQASARLGVSAKTLRLYELQGLLAPDRTRAGWRTYDAPAMARAADIVALRRLGLTLAEVAQALDGSAGGLAAALAVHEARLHEQGQRTNAVIARVRSLRASILQGQHPSPAELPEEAAPTGVLEFGFALPWPWGGEWFSIPDIPPLAFITGPLGSGKTRFAQSLAAAIPRAAFVGLDRVSDPAITRRLAEDAPFVNEVERRLAELVADGAERSAALVALVAALEDADADVLVVDMVEEGLGAATQVALMAHLRGRETSKRALILMTRSSAILDLDALRPSEVIFFCPANHQVPLRVAPAPGGRGYESVATCIATPAARARTAGVVAMRQQTG